MLVGMYSVDLLSRKTLFQIQAERLIKVQELAKAAVQKKQTQRVQSSVPWYIMTSENTQHAIKDFFARKNYFDLSEKDVVFFEQNTMPCLNKSGKVLLDQKYKISRSPDGNGGLYKALLSNHILEDMASRGIKYVHVYCVDNILCRVADPIFIGFCLDKKADCAAKVDFCF